MSHDFSQIGTSANSAARRLTLIKPRRFAASTLVEDVNPPKTATRRQTRKARRKPTVWKCKTSQGLRRVYSFWSGHSQCRVLFIVLDKRVHVVKLQG